MPQGSLDQRATEQAALARVVHTRNTDPRIGDWLDKISPNNEIEAANIRLIKKGYERDCKVPTELNASIAEVTSKAHGIWASARQNENVPEYLPILAEIIKLKIEKASALTEEASIMMLSLMSMNQMSPLMKYQQCSRIYAQLWSISERNPE